MKRIFIFSKPKGAMFQMPLRIRFCFRNKVLEKANFVFVKDCFSTQKDIYLKRFLKTFALQTTMESLQQEIWLDIL